MAHTFGRESWRITLYLPFYTDSPALQYRERNEERRRKRRTMDAQHAQAE